MALHISHGRRDLEYIRSLSGKGRYVWTMPKSALVDDSILIYLLAPHSAIAAIARVHDNWGKPSDEWPRRVLGRITDLEQIDPLLTREHMLSAPSLKGWKWPRSPQTQVTVPMAFESPLLKLLGDPPAPRTDAGVRAVEGEAREATYLARSRNRGLRDAVIGKSGGICYACARDFRQLGGTLWTSVLEAHHLVPVHTLTEPTVNSEEDLVALCPTCHRLAHAQVARPRNVTALRKLVAKLMA